MYWKEADDDELPNVLTTTGTLESTAWGGAMAVMRLSESISNDSAGMPSKVTSVAHVKLLP